MRSDVVRCATLSDAACARSVAQSRSSLGVASRRRNRAATASASLAVSQRRSAQFRIAHDQCRSGTPQRLDVSHLRSGPKGSPQRSPSFALRQSWPATAALHRPGRRQRRCAWSMDRAQSRSRRFASLRIAQGHAEQRSVARALACADVDDVNGDASDYDNHAMMSMMMSMVSR